MNIQRLIRPHLVKAKAYSSARDEYTGTEGVFLDANENPHGSAAGEDYNRYPDPYQKELKEAISQLKDVPMSHIFLGNGSDEPIDLLIRAFCTPKEEYILIFPPTYGMYEVSAGIQDVAVKKVLLSKDFHLNVPAIQEQLTPEAKITFICSPNNPSGNRFRKEDILEVVGAAQGIVVIDEAYIDFSEDESYSRFLDQFPNLVILQTFSKAWGMASLRLGMAFAHPEVVSILNRIKPPYNISGPVQGQALEAIRTQQSVMKEWVQMILAERQRLIPLLEELSNVLAIFPSDTNFLLVKFKEADDVFEYLLSQKVIVRNRSTQPLCDGCLRLTIGTPEENNRLLAEIKAFIL